MSVELTKLGNLALLRLNRPKSLNALSFAILHEISSALVEVSSWQIRGLIITGAGEKGVLRRSGYQRAQRPSPYRTKAGSGIWPAHFRSNRASPVSLDRRHQRIRFWRRSGTRARLYVPISDAQREAWTSGNQVGSRPRIWRHAAACPPHWRSACTRDDSSRAVRECR